MPTKQNTKLQVEIEENHSRLEQARSEAQDLKQEIDALPATLQAAREEGRAKAAKNHEDWVSQRAETGTKRRRSNVNSHAAEQFQLAEAPLRSVRQAEKLLRVEYREARARVADLEATSWRLERGRIRAEGNASDLDQREEKARKILDDAQAELEGIQGARSRLEGADRRATRECAVAERMARALRSGEADSDGFIGVR